MDPTCTFYFIIICLVHCLLICMYCVCWICKTVHPELSNTKKMQCINTACQTDGFIEKTIVFHPDCHIDLCI